MKLIQIASVETIFLFFQQFFVSSNPWCLSENRKYEKGQCGHITKILEVIV